MAHVPHSMLPERLTVLVAEDDESMLSVLAATLTDHGFRPVHASTVQAALRLVERSRTDARIALIDLRLPGEGSGRDVLAACARYDLPAIVVTASDDLADRIVALEQHADDYLVKPFAAREAVARIRAVLRRREAPYDAGFRINAARSCIEFSKEASAVYLTGREFRVLQSIAAGQGLPVLRCAILASLGYNADLMETRLVDTLVARIRRKCRSISNVPIILGDRGLGYRLAIDPSRAALGVPHFSRAG